MPKPVPEPAPSVLRPMGHALRVAPAPTDGHLTICTRCGQRFGPETMGRPTTQCPNKP